MRKFLKTFHNYLLGYFEYRFEILSGFIINSVELLISVFLWGTIIHENGSIGGYDLAGIMSYFVLGRIFAELKSPELAKMMEKYIRSGKLSNLLIMPYSPIIRMVGKTAAACCMKTLLSLIVFLTPYIFVSGMRPTLVINISNIFWLTLFILFSLAFNWGFWFCFGSLSFWMVRTSGLRNVVGQITTILRGSWFPIDLAPMWFQSLAGWLPFQYLIFYPIKILTTETDTGSNFKGLLVLLVSTLFFVSCSRVLWKKGLKSYSAVGL